MVPDPEKIETIQKLENPTNKQELHRMLGMVNHLRHFIPNMSELVSPIRKLLRKMFCGNGTILTAKFFRN